MYKGMQVLFNYTVEHLGLTITLRMVCRAHLHQNATQAEEFLPEVANEQRISIENYALGKALKFHHRVHE